MPLECDADKMGKFRPLEHYCMLQSDQEPLTVRKIGIIGTLGTALRSVETLKEMISSGLNIARLDFSHGTHEYHAETVAFLRRAVQELSDRSSTTPVVVGIALDTSGPENFDLPAVSEKQDLRFGVNQGVDMIFASFVRDAKAVKQIRNILGKESEKIQIISKIENQQSLNNIDEIVAESDGIMVAREEDFVGMEMSPEKVVKMMVSRCSRVNKPIVVPTQLLESLRIKIEPRPELAGFDFVMLSGEAVDTDLNSRNFRDSVVESSSTTSLNDVLFPEWSSLLPRLQLYPSSSSSAVDLGHHQSCLHTFPEDVARDITRRLCISMAPGSHSRSSPNNNHNNATQNQLSYLSSSDAIEWSMQVLQYALTRHPLDEHETIKAAINIYSEWLSVALPHPRPFIPECVRAEPNVYIRRILRHLFDVFCPRSPTSDVLLSKQAFLCHRALKLVEDLLSESPVGLLDNATWEQALVLLLSVNDMLLSPPTTTTANNSSNLADAHGERCLGALFRCWQTACTRPHLHRFPSYVEWKTFHEAAKAWRHRLPLVEMWIRTTVYFSRRVVERLKSADATGGETTARPSSTALEEQPTYRQPTTEYQQQNLKEARSATLMDADAMLVSWCLFTFLIGNPNDLCRPHVIAKTEQLLSAAVVMPPSSAAAAAEALPECLAILPLCYLKAFSGLSAVVDMHIDMLLSADAAANSSSFDDSVAPYLDIAWPGLRPTAKVSSSSFPTVDSLAMKPKHRPLRNAHKTNVRGLLSFYGPWLFEATLSNAPSYRHAEPKTTKDDGNSVESAVRDPPSEARQKTTALWAPGRAEAAACVCRIVCMHQPYETIPAALAARAVAALASGLDDGDYMTATNIVGNGADLFRSHVDGIECLWPAVLDVVSQCLLQSSMIAKSQIHPELQEGSKLRQACLYIVSSIVCGAHLFATCSVEVEDARRALRTDAASRRSASEQKQQQQSDTLTSNFSIFDDGDEIAAGDDLATPTTVAGVKFDDAEQQSMISARSKSAASIFHKTIDLVLNCMNAAHEQQQQQNRQNQQLLLSLANALINVQFYYGAQAFGNTASSQQVCEPLLSFRLLMCLTEQLTCDNNKSHDLTFARGALEILLTTARMLTTTTSHDVLLFPRETHAALVRSNVNAVCHFIRTQTARPPTAHSKDLHNLIILAYRCLLMWVSAEPLHVISSSSSRSDDENESTLALVAQVLELGTHGAAPATTTTNHSSSGSPVSIRVRDVAEQVRTQLLEGLPLSRCYAAPPLTTTTTTTANLSATTGSSSFEQALLDVVVGRRCRNGDDADDGAAAKIHVGFLDDSTILSLIDMQQSNGDKAVEDGDACWWSRAPTFAVVRNAAGMSTWLCRQQRRRLRRRKTTTARRGAENTTTDRQNDDGSLERAEKVEALSTNISDVVDAGQQQNNNNTGDDDDDVIVPDVSPYQPKRIIQQEFRKLVDELPGVAQIPECAADRIFSTIDELTYNHSSSSTQQQQRPKQMRENAQEEMPELETDPKSDFQALLEYVQEGFERPTVRNVWSDLPSKSRSVGAVLKKGFKRMSASPCDSRDKCSFGSSNMPSVAVSQLAWGLGLHDPAAANFDATLESATSSFSSSSTQNNNKNSSPTSNGRRNTQNGGSTHHLRAAAGISVRSNSTYSRSATGTTVAPRPTAQLPTPVAAASVKQRQSSRSVLSTTTEEYVPSATHHHHRIAAALPAESRRRLSDELVALDAVPTRPLDWLLVFYVQSPVSDAAAAGCTTESSWRDILRNTLPLDVNIVVDAERPEAAGPKVQNPEYFWFLQSLGYIVDVEAGTTFRTTKSDIVDDAAELNGDAPSDGKKSETNRVRYLDGFEHMLYYADQLAQLGILVPSVRNCFDYDYEKLSSLEREYAETTNNTISDDNQEKKELPQSIAKHQNSSNIPIPVFQAFNFTMQGGGGNNSITRSLLYVVWLDTRDAFSEYRLPVHDLHKNCRLLPLLQPTTQSNSNLFAFDSSSVIVYIAPHICVGLYELFVRNAHTGERIDVLMPIHDGQIVSHRVLAPLVRQCALNFYANQRLNENVMTIPSSSSLNTSGSSSSSTMATAGSSTTAAAANASSLYVRRRQIIHDLARRFGGGGGGGSGGKHSVQQEARTTMASTTSCCPAVTEPFLFW